MNIRYEFLINLIIITLSIIFIAEGLDLLFRVGLNPYLLHVFWIIVAFYLGIIVCKRWVIV